MAETALFESFSGQLDPRLEWFCPPDRFSLGAEGLCLWPAAQTDFWQRTHYGFRNDNGHFLYAVMEGDFVLTTKVHLYPENQYDQAGLMVRFSPDFWIKTSIEFEPQEPNRLGVVVTRQGFSDWSTQDVPKSWQDLQLRLRREGDDYLVEYWLNEQERWSQIRMAHLENPGQSALQCGLYACSPIAAGFKAQFEFLRIDPRRV
jgi:regulation of enolase protein 1 (concanavalin A-like superfamily)